MSGIKIVLRVIGVSQLVLGAAFLFLPGLFVELMGLSSISNDINYLLGMLAARFLVFGIGMFFVARDPVRNKFWIAMMLVVQAVDLLVGGFYTLSGDLSLSSSAFPMFNASSFIVLLVVFYPRLSDQ